MASAAQPHGSASLYLSASARDVGATKFGVTRSLPRVLPFSIARITTSFVQGSPLLVWRTSSPRKHGRKATSIRSEQSTKDSSGLDVWLGRFAMIGFAVGLGIEITTGKGVLENFGLRTPLPTVALAVTALVGVLTAIFIFQSASKD